MGAARSVQDTAGVAHASGSALATPGASPYRRRRSDAPGRTLPPARRRHARSTLGDRRSISPHERTRRDHATETAEDYVETIAQLIAREGSCRVTDLAARFGVTHVTVIRTIQRLEREGLVTTEPYKPVELTPRGRRLAEECAQRHDVVYRFLLAIGVDPATAAVDAEGIEHHVSRATLDRFRAIAQAPATSPPPAPRTA